MCLYFSPPGMYANDTSLTLVGVDQSIVYDYLTYVTVWASWKAYPNFFKFVRLKSVLIFSILNHPCSFMVYYYLVGVFCILVNYYFHVFFDLKVILAPGQKKSKYSE